MADFAPFAPESPIAAQEARPEFASCFQCSAFPRSNPWWSEPVAGRAGYAEMVLFSRPRRRRMVAGQTLAKQAKAVAAVSLDSWASPRMTVPKWAEFALVFLHLQALQLQALR